MISLVVTLFLLAGVGFASSAPAAPASCPALVKQDEECRAIAEKRQSLCPEGGSSAECRSLSEQIAGKCTRSPCAAPRKARGKRASKRARSKRR
jgi:hypothetical protein